jgi:hypothetical protein
MAARKKKSVTVERPAPPRAATPPAEDGPAAEDVIRLINQLSSRELDRLCRHAIEESTRSLKGGDSRQRPSGCSRLAYWIQQYSLDRDDTTAGWWKNKVRELRSKLGRPREHGERNAIIYQLSDSGMGPAKIYLRLRAKHRQWMTTRDGTPLTKGRIIDILKERRRHSRGRKRLPTP